MIKARLALSSLALALVLFSGGCCHEELCRSDAAPTSGGIAPAAPATNAAETYVKSELYFGLSKPGGTVSEAEWKSFLNEHVTPAFPDGLTVIDGYGQWKNDSGKIVKENSKVLILIHKPGADANTKLDAISSSYKKLFQQESVLRVTTAATVSF